MDKKRFSIQAAAALLQNANFRGFFTGKLYTGDFKRVCVPGLNCYSCPGAVGACPIGSLQSFLSAMRFRVPYYVLGLLLFFGALLGRAVCGFLCPFGWIQELLYLIPTPKKNRFRADRPLRTVKYAVLLIFVLVLPFFIKLTPVFCKLICPAGTLAGVLLGLSDKLVQAQQGLLFAWKLLVLLLVLCACVIIWRPFCKYLCPLGAIYGFFNKLSVYRMRLDKERCVSCGACARACRMCLDPVKELNHAECIRCGDCARACPGRALHLGFHNDRLTQIFR